VGQDFQEGLQITAKTLRAGKNALRERDYRRMGLGFSLASIWVALVGLRLYMRQIDGKSR
jgi:hypothetical protein